MNHHCVHIDIDLNISTEEWLRHCQQVVDKFISVPGLDWKLWVASPTANAAGGIYLFRDEAAATAYVNGPVIAALRGNPDVHDVRIRSYTVDDDLSRRTGAVRASDERAS